MAGRRLTPNPATTQPISEVVDPSLAQPVPGGPRTNPGTGPNVGTAPMVNPHLLRAEQMAAEAAAQIPGFQSADEPFMTLHGDEAPEGEEAPEPESEEVTELTDEERMEFASLLTVGRRSKVIDVFGHPVQIESLSAGDDQRIGLYCKEYQGAPPADSRSYQIAVVACGIRKIDDGTFYTPLSSDETEQSIFITRVERVKKLYPPVLTEIYRAILDLDQDFAKLAEKLKNQRG